MAYDSLERLEAKIETGLTKIQYIKAVGNTWADVKPFVESKDAKRHAEVAECFILAMDDYRYAGEKWDEYIETKVKASIRDSASKQRLAESQQRMMKNYWDMASSHLKWAKRLLGKMTRHIFTK